MEGERAATGPPAPAYVWSAPVPDCSSGCGLRSVAARHPDASLALTSRELVAAMRAVGVDVDAVCAATGSSRRILAPPAISRETLRLGEFVVKRYGPTTAIQQGECWPAPPGIPVAANAVLTTWAEVLETCGEARAAREMRERAARYVR